MANTKKRMKLASEGKRLGAYCIDAIIPAILIVLYSTLYLRIMMRVFDNLYNYYQYDQNPFGFGYGYGNGFGGYGNGFGPGYGYGSSSSGLTSLVIVALILSIAYIVVQVIFFRQSKTLGKAIVGMQVVSAKDGKPIGFWKMILREWIVKRASASVLFLGFIWVLIDDRNRGWHDKILDTYVVDIKESRAITGAQAANVGASIEETAAAVKEAADEALKIETMVAEENETPAEEPKTAELAAKADPAEHAHRATDAVPAKSDVKLSMAMKKDELIKAAEKCGAEVNDKMTKSEIIDAAEKAKAK